MSTSSPLRQTGIPRSLTSATLPATAEGSPRLANSTSLPSLPRVPPSPLRNTSLDEQGAPAEGRAANGSSSLSKDPKAFMISPGPTSNDIQAHLYQAFLEGRTADVVLHVRGSWHALYRLHRVVLIQSGFFQSLFTAGFVESKHKFKAAAGLQPDEVEVVFDDPNITRAAFEICVARLYGGGPPLHVTPSLTPTPSVPLTPLFPCPTADRRPSCPPSHHPTSPRTLLSLLATAVYLSIPSVASQALGLILNTVGPYTVMRYLGFAVGKGIGEADEDGSVLGQRETGLEGARGLEGIAESLGDDVGDTRENSENEMTVRYPHEGNSGTVTGDNTAIVEDADAEDMEYMDVEKEKAEPSAPPSPSSFPSSSPSQEQDDLEEPSYFYGAVSSKIGEAAACWLARWGIDLLQYELAVASDSTASSTGFVLSDPPSWARRRRRISVTGPNAQDQPMASTSSPSSYSPSSASSTHNPIVPRIWRRGGLSPRWVKALIASDFLFVPDELERYRLARDVVELRRREAGGIIMEEEESVWEDMFREGCIGWENLAFEDLMATSKEVSPTTGRPYVPLDVLQVAVWNQSMLRHHITARSLAPQTPPPSSSSSAAKDKELGVTLTVADLVAGEGEKRKEKGKVKETEEKRQAERKQSWYSPVPTDASVRIGDTAGLEKASMDELFTAPGFSGPQPVDPKKVARLNTSESTFFGLLSSSSQRRPASACTSGQSGGWGKRRIGNATQKLPDRWSPFPPMRFGVEFWDVDALKEKSRLHSKTVWYAGSLWNVYVQVVRKKTGSGGTAAGGANSQLQLGVYLHRQSCVDPVPAASAPRPTLESTAQGASGHRRGGSESNGRQGPVQTPRRSSASSTSGFSLINVPTTPTRSATPVHLHPSPQSPYTPSSSPGTSLSHITPSHLPPTVPYTSTPVTPAQPYRDPRSAISAYFTIACASATGASLTQFTSAPDMFSVSQSWGWKSSSLRTEEYLECNADGEVVGGGREVSLRAMVVVGLV